MEFQLFPGKILLFTCAGSLLYVWKVLSFHARSIIFYHPTQKLHVFIEIESFVRICIYKEFCLHSLVRRLMQNHCFHLHIVSIFVLSSSTGSSPPYFSHTMLKRHCSCFISTYSSHARQSKQWKKAWQIPEEDGNLVGTRNNNNNKKWKKMFCSFICFISIWLKERILLSKYFIKKGLVMNIS